MSEPIKAGDLVMIVHDCCTGEHLGEIYRVEGIERGMKCQDCGYEHDGSVAWLPEHEEYDEGWWPSAWLKRIPPLEELDDVKREEEITA